MVDRDGVGAGTAAQELQDLLDMEAAVAAKPSTGGQCLRNHTGRGGNPQAAIGCDAQHVPTMSNDRLQRIAQGTQHGDKDAAPAKEKEGGKTRAINRVGNPSARET